MKNEHFLRKRLVKIAEKIEKGGKITPSEIDLLENFTTNNQDSTIFRILKNSALPLSLVFGFLITVFSTDFSSFVKTLPKWTYLSKELLAGVDYLWDLLGEPVGEKNIIYHIPNIILYSFGILGIKKLFDAIDKKTWLDRVRNSQKNLKEQLMNGIARFSLKKGHSILFVGNGDFIGMQFAINHEKNETITISLSKPHYTNIWNMYDANTSYEDLKNVLSRCDMENAGEYVFFPVKDDQIFLPSLNAYDLSSYKLDILCQNIRMIEKSKGIKPRKIIIVGDKNHKSFVVSEDQSGVLQNTKDTISLLSISKKYRNITLIDPSDIVMNKIKEIANGRKVVFRATTDGIKEYKKRFYDRLKESSYKQNLKKRGILTIGYDLFEDQTEQQTLARKIDDYYPVVLSKNVRDALIRNGYRKEEFIYVPDLVLGELSQKAAEQ